MKIVLLILLTHFVADFIFQTDKQAINKSTSNLWLTKHVLTYMLGLQTFAIIHVIFFLDIQIYTWVVVNGVLHWITDYFTSRLNSYLWKKEMRHWFFVGIGADQMIHYTCLLLSYEMLIK